MDEAVARLVAEFNPDAIYLFGSHAWGSPDDDSDVDFFIVVKESNEKPVRRAQRAHCSLIGMDFPKDVLVRTRMEVDENRFIPSSITSKILKQGRRIYG